jgi:tRNA uridine 5-carboxymethylaminomethyl modification enzyme
MFTSRAEYRLLLREDNADLRLTEIGQELGVIVPWKWQQFCQKKAMLAASMQKLETIIVHPNTKVAANLEAITSAKLEREYRALELLKRPEVGFAELMNAVTDSAMAEMDVASESAAEVGVAALLAPHLEKLVNEQVEIQVKYEGYIKRQAEEIAKQAKFENLHFPVNFGFDDIAGLSNEVKEKLRKHNPETIAQASRIAGVTPAAISLLIVAIKRSQLQQEPAEVTEEA